MTGLQTCVPEAPSDMLEKAKSWGAARVIVIAETQNGQMMWGSSFGEAEGLNWLLDLAKTDLAMRCLVKKDERRDNPPLDSKEGMIILFDWARCSGAVLSEHHERLAAKHGVSTEGVTISRPLPTH